MRINAHVQQFPMLFRVGIQFAVGMPEQMPAPAMRFRPNSLKTVAHKDELAPVNVYQKRVLDFLKIFGKLQYAPVVGAAAQKLSAVETVQDVSRSFDALPRKIAKVVDDIVVAHGAVPYLYKALVHLIYILKGTATEPYNVRVAEMRIGGEE